VSEFNREAEALSRKIAEISQKTLQPVVRFYCKRGDHYLHKTELLFDAIGKPRCPTHKINVQQRTDKRINRNTTASATCSGKLPLCFKPPNDCQEQYLTGIEGNPRIFCMAEEPCWRQAK